MLLNRSLYHWDEPLVVFLREFAARMNHYCVSVACFFHVRRHLNHLSANLLLILSAASSAISSEPLSTIGVYRYRTRYPCKSSTTKHRNMNSKSRRWWMSFSC